MGSRRFGKVMVTFALALVTLLPGLSALALDGHGQWAGAMGRTGLALNLGADSFFANPALLGLSTRAEHTFIGSVGFGDDLVDHGGQFRFERPQTDGSITFMAKNLALTIESRTTFEDHQDWGSFSTYRGDKLTLLELDWAFGRGPISLGVRAQVVATSVRSEVTVNNDQLLLDYFIQSAIARYESVGELSSVSFGLGVLLDYDWISMGVVVGKFAYSTGEDPLTLDSDSLLKTLSWGLSLSSPTYNASNELRLFRAQGALDLVNLGSNETREARGGLSVKLQLLPDYSLSLLTGYRELKRQASDLIRISLVEGRHSIGLGGELGNAELLVLYEYPTAWYTNTPADAASTLSFSVSIRL